MKINRTWSVDIEVANKMRYKYRNQSSIVNQLLKRHLKMLEDYGNDSIAIATDVQIAAVLHNRVEDSILKEMLLVYIKQAKREKDAKTTQS